MSVELGRWVEVRKRRRRKKKKKKENDACGEPSWKGSFLVFLRGSKSSTAGR